MASSPAAGQSKLPFFAWLFLIWMAIAAIAAAQRGIGFLRDGNTPFGAGALIVALILTTGILLMVARHSRARAYWLWVIAAFITACALGLFAPEARDLAELTIVVMSVWFAYFWRSTRIRAALTPVLELETDDERPAAPAV